MRFKRPSRQFSYLAKQTDCGFVNIVTIWFMLNIYNLAQLGQTGLWCNCLHAKRQPIYNGVQGSQMSIQVSQPGPLFLLPHYANSPPHCFYTFHEIPVSKLKAAIVVLLVCFSFSIQGEYFELHVEIQTLPHERVSISYNSSQFSTHGLTKSIVPPFLFNFASSPIINLSTQCLQVDLREIRP